MYVHIYTWVLIHTKKTAQDVGCFLPSSLYTLHFETGSENPESLFQLDRLANKLELQGCTCLLLPHARLQTCLWIWPVSWRFWFTSCFHSKYSYLRSHRSRPHAAFLHPKICFWFFFLLFFLLLSTQSFWDPTDDTWSFYFLGGFGNYISST